MKKQQTLKMVFIALFCALSIVLVYFIHFPIFPSAPFLEYDPADVMIFICTFLFGPLAGCICTIVVSFLQWFLVSPQSGWYGFVMHIIATGSFVLVAGLIYKFKHTLSGSFIALICGTITMALVMMPANLIITPIFSGMPVSAVWDMMPVIVGFNAIKAGGNAILSFVLYKSVGRSIEKMVKE